MVTFEYIFMFSIFSFRFGRDDEAEFFGRKCTNFRNLSKLSLSKGRGREQAMCHRIKPSPPASYKVPTFSHNLPFCTSYCTGSSEVL